MITISSKFFFNSQGPGPCAYYLRYVTCNTVTPPSTRLDIDKDDDDDDDENGTLEHMGDSAPVTAASPSAPAVPQRRAHHEVIDVDELDDYPPSRRPRLQVHSSETRASSDIIVLDSDDGETGPSTRPRSTGELASSAITSS